MACHRGVGALPGRVEIRALGVVLGGLDAVRLAGLLDILFLDPVGQILEMHRDSGRGVARMLLGIGADREDLRPDPLDLVPHIDDVDVALVAADPLRGRGVDADDPPVRDRRGHQPRVEHAVQVAVVGVLRLAARLLGAVDALVPLADQAAICRRRPIVLRSHYALPPLAASYTALRTPT